LQIPARNVQKSTLGYATAMTVARTAAPSALAAKDVDIHSLPQNSALRATSANTAVRQPRSSMMVFATRKRSTKSPRKTT